MTKYAKIIIEGKIELKSGLHVGGSDAFAAIGATDSPVIKDPLAGLPMIPGSSLKGKIRSLLARAINEKAAGDANSDHELILNLFGSSKKGDIRRARLVFSDCVMTREEQKRLKEMGARTATEVKFENTINRITAVANPRQIERVVRGAEFPFSLVYEIGPKTGKNGAEKGEQLIYPDDNEIKQDFDLISKGLQLLEFDYLGGSGTRGYGKVKFVDCKVKLAFGEDNNELLESLNAELSQL